MVFSDLIALYLFLGGTAAGSFAVLSAVGLSTAIMHARKVRVLRYSDGYFGGRFRSMVQMRIARVGYSVAFVMMLVGLLCLLADLGRPEAFYLLFLYPTSSFVSVGTFALTFLTICMGVALLESVLVLGRAWERAALVAKGIGLILSVVVMMYTGLLLESVVAVRLWSSLWLPVLFLFSALSCGCGVILLVSCLCEGYSGVHVWVRRISAADAVFIVLEAVSLAAYAITIDAADPMHPFAALAYGSRASAFWLGFVGCGIVVPFAMEAAGLASSRGLRSGFVAFMALIVMVGGLCLRFALVGSGIQAAI